MKVTLRFRDRPSLIIMRGEQPNNSNFTSIPMPSRSSQREGRPTLRSERTPKPEEPETNRGLINISKFNGLHQRFVSSSGNMEVFLSHTHSIVCALAYF